MRKKLSQIAGLICISFSTVLFISQNSAAITQDVSQKKSNFNLSDSWIGEPASNFRKLKSVSAKKHMISTSDILASQAGEEMLAKGGNAIDAIIAAQLVLNVVEPQSSGIGGGGFLLYFDAKTKKTTYFNGRENSPAKAHAKMFLDKNGKAKDFTEAVKGGKSVGTPGVLKILKEAHEKYGKLSWKEVFQPAIKLSRNGFPMNDRLHTLASSNAYIRDFRETAEIYINPNGKTKDIGETVTNPQMAKTLETIAQEGIEPFYSGKIAKDMVRAVQNSKINPGYLSLADLKKYRSKTGDLLCATYREKYKICSMPLPSSGGVTLLEILGILENFDLSKLKPQSAEFVHLVSEATRLAYADRNEYLADTAGVPIDKMLNKNYLKSRSQLISMDKSMSKVEAGIFTEIVARNTVIDNNAIELPCTTHLSAVDDEGNAISFTSSIEYFFGSGITVDGFLLNNQLTDFSFLPEINGKKVANRIEPNKQPRSSMTPTFVFDKDDKLIMILGSPGGPNIIQYSLKTILGYLDFHQDIQKIISMPNFVILNDVLQLEKGTEITKLEKKLQNLGHQTKINDITSGIHAIVINDNELIGGADPRRGGAAVGF
jgi:gamma-glutamyltranspeptidase/glutathione hydrolase